MRRGNLIRIHRQAVVATKMLAPSGIDALPMIQQQVFRQSPCAPDCHSCAELSVASFTQTPLVAAGVSCAFAPTNSPSPEQLVFAGIYAGLGLGTAAAQPLFGALEKALPEGWFENWSKTWPALGIVFMLAGVAHFTAQGAFMSIYPPAGTWGMWALPGSVMTNP